MDSEQQAADPRGSLRILFVATQLPAPQDAGGKIRSFHIMRQLARIHDLTFVCTVSPSTDESLLNQVRSICPNFIAVPFRTVSINSWRYLLKLAGNFFGLKPFGIAKDYSPELSERVVGLARSGHYDLIVCDYLHAMINLRDLDSVPVLLFQHNVEAEILQRHYQQARNPMHRLFWFYQWKKLESFERRTARKAASCVAVSERDRLIFKHLYGFKNVFAIDTGVDIAYFSGLTGVRKPHQMLFTGSMDWRPNEDAMVFFSREVMPQISGVIPDVSLKIVGRGPGKRVQMLAEGNPKIQVTGRVEDVRPFLAESSLFVVPVRIAGGTRIKIFEAMASSIPVVSTRIGAEGLSVTDQVHLLLADTPEDFAAAAVRLMRDTTLARNLAEKAKAFVSANNDWEIIGRQFSDICYRTVQYQKGSGHEN
ncbi:MAG: glycosyltransferase family 4 protein [Acidobacteriia bacterium]|nr:glycosyltransferase family 4 protein [Terriglobia bacterium]